MGIYYDDFQKVSRGKDTTKDQAVEPLHGICMFNIPVNGDLNAELKKKGWYLYFENLLSESLDQ